MISFYSRPFSESKNKQITFKSFVFLDNTTTSFARLKIFIKSVLVKVKQHRILFAKFDMKTNCLVKATQNVKTKAKKKLSIKKANRKIMYFRELELADIKLSCAFKAIQLYNRKTKILISQKISLLAKSIIHTFKLLIKKKIKINAVAITIQNCYTKNVLGLIFPPCKRIVRYYRNTKCAKKIGALATPHQKTNMKSVRNIFYLSANANGSAWKPVFLKTLYPQAIGDWYEKSIKDVFYGNQV